MVTAAADRDDGVGVVQVNTFDTDDDAEDFGTERDGQMFLEHAEQADALFRLAVRVNDGLFDEFVEPAPAERVMRPLDHRSARPTRRASAAR